jgi:metallo-beta-lactamase family protein
MDIQFLGAAREVTGSCHVVRAAGRTVLLDCGMFQGRRRETDAKNRRLPVAVGEIDAIVLSHAHIDHSGRLPFLVAQGYDGPIHATAATRGLCAVMLRDSANIQVKDAEFLRRRGREVVEPLYDVGDAMEAVSRTTGHPYDRWFDVAPGIRALFTDAGHILGSASVVLEATEGGQTRRLVFSGDVGRTGLPIIRDPRPPAVPADLVILESTYGNRDHESVAGAREHLARVVRETVARGGRVLVPAFAVGRAQELVYDLHALGRDGAIPEVPIYVDSPLAIDATTVFETHPEVFDRTEAMVREVPELFRFPLVRYARTTDESRALNTATGPMVILAGSGMAESGRILHHLLHGAADHRNTVLIVGFQAEHTLGRRIVERRPFLRVFGEDVALRAQVEVLNGYSAHADRTELTRWLDAVRGASARVGASSPARVCLVHGESGVQDAFAEALRGRGYDVTCPGPGATVPW